MEKTVVHSHVRGSGYIFTRTCLHVTALLVLLTAIASGIALLASPVSPVAAVTTVPTKMNFQGRLTDATGNIKPNGSYNMKLKLYTVSSAGSPVWSEDRLVSATQGVPVTNGLFSIQLGEYASLPASLFAGGPLYLEVELASPATATSASPAWTEGAMSPRNQLATSAYAYNAETLDGMDSAAFAQTAGNNTWTGTNLFKNTTDSTSGFSIQNAAGSNLLSADTINGQLSVQAFSRNEAPVYGSEMMTSSYGFAAAAGWSAIGGTGYNATATHGSMAGTTAVSISPALPVEIGASYRLDYWIKDSQNITQHYIKATAGGNDLGWTSAPGATTTGRYITKVFTATTTDNLTFVPSDYASTVEVSKISLRKITDPYSLASLQVRSVSGSVALEVRTGGEGLDNSLVGLQAGASNILGKGNAAFGAYALQGNMTGNYNLAMGYHTMQSNVSGSYNAALGIEALRSNTSGSDNVAIGGFAMYENLSGGENVAIGTGTMQNNVDGGDNTAIGAYALSNNAASSFSNTVVGAYALSASDAGSNNTIIGAYADIGIDGIQNATAIGQSAIVDCSDCLVLGGTGVDAVSVGIGTAAPTAKLHVVSEDSSEVALHVQQTQSIAATGTKTFVKNIGGSGDDIGRTVITTSDGGYATSSSTDSYGAGAKDVLVSKYSSSGSLQWSRALGGTADEPSTYSSAIVQVSDGGYAVVYATYSYSPGGSADAIVTKLNSSGVVQWSRTLGSGNIDYFASAFATSDGGFVAGGSYIDNGLVGGTLLVKYDASGTLQWKSSYLTFVNIIQSVKATSDGGYITTGVSSVNTSGGDDLVVSKFNSSGVVQWQYNFGGSGSEYGYDIEQTSDSGFIVVGTQSSYSGTQTGFVLKLSSTGTLSWSRGIGGTGSTDLTGVHVNGDGTYTVVGGTQTSGNGNYDLFLAKLSSNGASTLWQKTWGGTQIDKGFSLAAGSDGGYVVTGSSTSYSGNTYYDIILAKFSDNGLIAACSSDCKTAYLPLFTITPGNTSAGTTAVTMASAITSSPAVTNSVVSPTSTALASYDDGVSATSTTINLINASSSGVTLGNINQINAFSVQDGSGLNLLSVNTLQGAVNVNTSLHVVGQITADSTSVFNGGVTVNAALTVGSNNATGYAQTINNTSTATTADGLLINLGVDNASRSSGNYFIGFAGANTVAGKIQGGASAVAYTTTAADYAEYFRANPADLPKAGELVSLDGTLPSGVKRASGSDFVTGVISTNPGFVGNGPLCKVGDEDCDINYAKDNVLVSLVGQVPLKVTGDVQIGDALGASTVPGVATKVTDGSIVGYALTNAENGMVQVLIRPGVLSPTSGAALQGGEGVFASLVVNGIATVDSLVVTGNATILGDLVVEGHLIAKGAKPTISAGTALGIMGARVVVDGADGAGTLTLLAGSQQQAPGVLAHITFAKAFDSSYKVTLSSMNENATDLRVYLIKTDTGFDIVSRDAPQAGQTYEFDYIVMGAKN